jgi:uncharacterized protein DUF2844
MHLLLLVAALGGRVASVDADRVQLQAALLRVQAAQTYTLHEIQSAAGITVREYVSSSGDVFAVAWEGPSMPDLRQVLGDYFATYQTAMDRWHAARRVRGPVAIDTGDFVIQVGGHMRSFSGRAYVKKLMPPSVELSAIR